MVAYGSKTLLAGKDKTGMETTHCDMAFRGTAGRQDISMQKPS